MRLSDENIENSVEEIRLLFENSAISPDDCVRICLMVEESLLRFQQHFGKEHEVNIKTQKWFGVPKVIIRLKGAPFDPFYSDEEDDEMLTVDVMQSLLKYEHAKTVYAYKNGYNEISTYATKAQKIVKIPGGAITQSILLAVIFAVLSLYLPSDLQTIITNDIATPLLKSLMGLIVAVTGPFVFISIVSSICIMDDVTTLNTIGLRVIRRFFTIMLLISVFTAGVCQVFFPVLSFNGEINADFAQFFKMLLDIIPDNLFTPFTEGNILQIVAIAFLTGVTVLMLANVVPNLKAFIQELNQLIFKIMDVVSKVMYVAIFLNVYQMIVCNSLDTILDVWKIILVTYIVCVGFGFTMLFYVAYKHKVNLTEFFRRGSEVFMIALSTGSAALTLKANMQFAKGHLGVDGKFADFWVPLSFAVFSPTSAPLLVLAVFYASSLAEMPLSIFSLIVTLILALQLSIARPPVPGGMIAVYAIAFNQLGLPQDSIGMLVAASVFCANMIAYMSMIIRDAELIDISRDIKNQNC